MSLMEPKDASAADTSAKDERKNPPENPSDEMSDRGGNRFTSNPELKTALGKFADLAFGAYEIADRDAARFQRCYRLWSAVSVTAGVVAVLIAILQLVGAGSAAHGSLPTLPVIELVLVLAAISAVVWVFHHQHREGWLCERSKAERLRALKYRTLLDPEFWKAPEARWPHVRREVAEIAAASTGQLECRLDQHVEIPTIADGTALTGNSVLSEAITAYYLERRLIAQAEFLRNRAEQLHRSDRRTKLAGPILFFLVLVFVFAHAIFDVVAWARSSGAPSHTAENAPKAGEAPKQDAAKQEAAKQDAAKQEAAKQDAPQQRDSLNETISRILIALAAALPVLGAGLHTYRSSREFGRNMWRFRAASSGLRRLQETVEAPQSSETEKLRAMLHSEYILTTEQQQWLQLMIECEWFG